jgi:tRNA/tmRNA/rRNA uracil-C5-methylase (TrmA/RlmC/RlmD family)
MKPQMKSQSLHIGQVFEAEISSLSSQGDGVGRFEGMVVFIENTAPGDLVRAKVWKRKKRFAHAELLEVIKPSPHRIPAPCPVYDLCGGCRWQHIEYSEQLKAKEKILKDQLSRIAKLDFPVPTVQSSPQVFNYRNRIQLQRGAFGVGYFQRNSKKIVKIDSCPLATSDLNALIPKIPAKKDGKPERIELYVSQKDQETRWQAMNAGHPPEGFSQVNQGQNRSLIRCVQELITTHYKKYPLQVVLDLYGGSGNFSRSLATDLTQLSFKVVERSPESVNFGRELAQHLSLRNVEFYLDSVEHFFLDNRDQLAKENCLILIDPPRAGLSPELCKEIIRQQAQGLIYVSCQPSTLARDLLAFIHASGQYQLKALEAFDMFPQTPHFEVVAYLESL